MDGDTGDDGGHRHPPAWPQTTVDQGRTLGLVSIGGPRVDAGGLLPTPSRLGVEATTIGSLADHALRYAIAGLEVFPVNANKTPMTPNGMKGATTTEAAVIDWWKQTPAASIGHRVALGVLIADVDFRHGGDTTWRALQETFGPVPDTRVHYSGRGDGGGHVWFGVDAGAKFSTHALDAWAKDHGVGHFNGQRVVSGVDLLHHGHRYSILPPSVHASSNKPYRWKGDGLAVPVAPMPAWLAELVVVQDDGNPEGVLASDVEKAGGRSGLPAPTVEDSIADWFTDTTTWSAILVPAGWTLRHGTGDADHSEWAHPHATNDKSATVRHGCLFVYSPNTPFDVTEDGNPHGYTRFAAWARLHHDGNLSAAAKAARVLRDGSSNGHRDLEDVLAMMKADKRPEGHTEDVEDTGPHPIDWPTFWRRDGAEKEWVCPSVVPAGRWVTMWATHKTGKSLLTLDIAAAYATGRPMLGQPSSTGGHVIYLDMEMTEDDLEERLEDFGYTEESDLDRLHYFLLPMLPPLDTDKGGVELARLVDKYAATFVVIDTLARVVEGDENEAATYANFYRHTGTPVKRRGVAGLRLDHGGKDPGKGPRGSSAKGDDVDVVWRLGPNGADKFVLVRERSRVSWIPERVELVRRLDPLAHVVEIGGARKYRAGTAELATQLAAEGFSPEVGGRTILRVMKERHGQAPGKNRVQDAQAWRRDQLYETEVSATLLGVPPVEDTQGGIGGPTELDSVPLGKSAGGEGETEDQSRWWNR